MMNGAYLRGRLFAFISIAVAGLVLILCESLVGQQPVRLKHGPPGGPASKPSNPAETQPATQPTQYGSPFGYAAISLGSGIDLKLALIPGGKFWMGGGAWGQKLNGQNGRITLYEVELSRPYYMGIYLLTEPQYAQVMGIKNFRKVITGRGKQAEPMASAYCPIKFDPATEFCKILSRKTGNTVRLPTEAEWERACRAGTRTWYFFGDNSQDLEKYAWVNSDFPRGSKQGETDGATNKVSKTSRDGLPIELARTFIVGKKSPNPWGLYDMYGNWQFCSDWFYTGGRLDRPGLDPKGPPTHGPRSNIDHVIKGLFNVGDHVNMDGAGSRSGTIDAFESRDSLSSGLSLRIVVEYPIVRPKDYVGVVKFKDFKQGKYLDEESYLVFATGMGNMTSFDDSLSVNGMGISVAVDNLNKTPSAPPKPSIIKQGEALQLAVLNKAGEDKLPAPDDESLYNTLQSAKSGDLLRVRFSVLNGQKVCQIVSAAPYTMAPGEDQPGVYVFQRTATMTLQKVDHPAVVLSKFLEETTLAVTDPKLEAGLGQFKTGDSVKVTVAGKFLKSIEAYRP